MGEYTNLQTKLAEARNAKARVAERKREEELAAEEAVLAAELERQQREQIAALEAEEARALAEAKRILDEARPVIKAFREGMSDIVNAVLALPRRAKEVLAPVHEAWQHTKRAAELRAQIHELTLSPMPPDPAIHPEEARRQRANGLFRHYVEHHWRHVGGYDPDLAPTEMFSLFPDWVRFLFRGVSLYRPDLGTKNFMR